jgi:hypothetical protein
MKRLILLICIFYSCIQWLPAQDRLHHLVLFRLKNGIDKKDPRCIQAMNRLQNLKKEIPRILDFRAGENFSTRPVATDFGLMVVLENQEQLDVYLEHPAHKAAVAAWKEIAEWNIADFMAPAGISGDK